MISLNSKRRSAKASGRLRALLVALVVALVTLAGATASAEDNKGEDKSLDEKLDTYWSVDRELPAVQERTFTREGRIGLGLYAGLLSSEPFYYYYPVGLRGSYFFNNFLGIEVEGSFMDAPGVLTHDTELTDFLEIAREDSFDKAIDTEDRFLWRANVLLTWHPLYGKLAFLQRKLTHFDFNLALGAGLVGVDRPDDLRQDHSSSVAPELVFGGGIQFFATHDIVLRLEGRGYVYQGAKTPSNEDSFVKQLQVPTEFLLGASYMF
ncbi:outer membrane beta-barrel domain-containing protein [Persicimonas caeni]|uniref:Outer membrane beta-barrel domain-containing protein n=1 Tax=Persicimonas caeni TaxID=2292766 RepID=A0A4Y6PXM8_PERCE|nr:outer membrane beta-barrel domain-containing protein [Persicimonas caeni]QDG52889.1 outer membrane beta-barrel domain-containing protein [Persicimonas caeni]QED34111.1 outer membrane beta-barrel domain-containing protein [Persicimonas caeni]